MTSPTAWQRVIWHPAMALAWLLATIYFIATVGFTTMRVAALVIQSIWLIIAIANVMMRGRVDLPQGLTRPTMHSITITGPSTRSMRSLCAYAIISPGNRFSSMDEDIARASSVFQYFQGDAT